MAHFRIRIAIATDDVCVITIIFMHATPTQPELFTGISCKMESVDSTTLAVLAGCGVAIFGAAAYAVSRRIPRLKLAVVVADYLLRSHPNVNARL